MIDVTVVNPVQQKYLVRAADTKDVAMDGKKEEKRDFYKGQQATNAIFSPLPFETFGGWDDDPIIMGKRLRPVVARNQGKEEGMEIRHGDGW